MVLRLFATSLFILLLSMEGVLAQAIPRPPAPPQAGAKPGPAIGTVGVVTGDIDSTGLRIASDLARALDSGTDLRVIPMAGRGSLQNINDLLTIRAVDIAIVQSDALARFLKISRQPGIQARMQYMAKLYSEEFHVLSRMKFLCLQDLTGRRVSFGPKDSGMAITAEAVFEANDIAVDPLYLDHEEALDRLKRGEIDALVYVGGKPSRAFDKITHKDKVHFLDVEYLPGLQGSYLPAIITSEDYPNLVAPNESVATIGVSTVMAVHNWPAQSERFRVVSRFTERFFASIDKLKSGSFSAKWREVNLSAPLKGWQRFQPAERWLAANAQANVQPATAAGAQQLKIMLQKFVESQRGSAAGQEELFNQFVRWYQQQNAQPSQLQQQQ
ncbi:MAG: TAXI family TRAP transporter solute-binding subunit [Rhodomicrobium sp.]